MVFHQTKTHKFNQDFNMTKAIIVSGYFNPIHKGHLELFAKAKAQGDELWVIVNSDYNVN